MTHINTTEHPLIQDQAGGGGLSSRRSKPEVPVVRSGLKKKKKFQSAGAMEKAMMTLMTNRPPMPRAAVISGGQTDARPSVETLELLH